MRKVLLTLVTLAVGAVMLGSCGGEQDDESRARSIGATTTSAPCTADEVMTDSGCVLTTLQTTTTTEPPPQEAVAFDAEYATMPEEMRLNFRGLSSDDVAARICSNQAMLMYVGPVGVEHYPDVARAAYAWKCPERVGEHDAAVLRAIAEDARRRAAAAAPTTTAPPSAPSRPSGESVSQQNARSKASSYLRYSAFSRSGLIDQLLYEGFSQGDATYGVDALNVNWNEQAAKKAASYLRYSAFSRSGLVDQLLYEGFTQPQAEYGVSTTGL